MPYEVKNFENLLGLAGFSGQLLKNHFALHMAIDWEAVGKRLIV